MKTEVVKHGIQYFINNGVYCPECDEIKFGIDTVLDVTPWGGPQKFIYTFRCYKCDCIFTVTEDK
jgi:hypothetical protein